MMSRILEYFFPSFIKREKPRRAEFYDLNYLKELEQRYIEGIDKQRNPKKNREPLNLTKFIKVHPIEPPFQ